MARPKLNTYTIALIKQDKADFDAIIEGNFSDDIVVNIDGQELGRLVVRDVFDVAPKWTKAFDGLVAAEVFGTTRSPGAVLLVATEGRKFAITFGFGWSLLAQEAIEEQFGLRVTLNCIDATAVKSLDKRSFDVVATQTREQASREIDVGEFGLDVDQDLLSSVTGVPRDKRWGEKMSGKNTLKVAVSHGIAELPALCAAYLERYGASDYEERFKWIDQVREISDPELIDGLDSAFIQRVLHKPNEPEMCWLAAPNIMDWADVAGFKFGLSKSGDTYPDIFWRDYFATLDDDEVSLEGLKKSKVVWIDANDSNRDRWSLYKCVNCEIERDGKMYLLNGGKWYEVEVDFVKRVNRFISEMNRSDLNLIPYSHAREDQYLRAATEAIGGQCVCMDKDNIVYGGGHSSVEFCDLFIDGCSLVHVKRYGASSTLSHLFAQGVTSGRLFASDADFRIQVNAKLPEAFRLANPLERVNTGNYEIVFGIISKEDGDGLTLPFFSRVNLQNSTRILEGLGFSVSLLKIKVEE